MFLSFNLYLESRSNTFGTCPTSQVKHFSRDHRRFVLLESYFQACQSKLIDACQHLGKRNRSFCRWMNMYLPISCLTNIPHPSKFFPSSFWCNYVHELVSHFISFLSSEHCFNCFFLSYETYQVNSPHGSEVYKSNHFLLDFQLIRLENEHLNNVGKYRAFKSVPLPFYYDYNGNKSV